MHSFRARTWIWETPFIDYVNGAVEAVVESSLKYCDLALKRVPLEERRLPLPYLSGKART
jgi:hypothetical protein